jgi:hypothetical protein
MGVAFVSGELYFRSELALARPPGKQLDSTYVDTTGVAPLQGRSFLEKFTE